MKFNPARAAAAAASSADPDPSERCVWTWNEPRAVGMSEAGPGCTIGRGGNGNAAKRKAAARTAAAMSAKRILDIVGVRLEPDTTCLQSRGLAKRVGAVRLFPGEALFGAAEVSER